MNVRNVVKMNTINNREHSRSIIESLMMPELISALTDWSTAGAGGVLIGTATLSFHVRPRMAQELEFLVLDDAAVPDAVLGFEQTGPTRFRHGKSAIEVNVVTPAAIEVPIGIADEVARTAMMSDGVRVASESGLVALKLFRRSRQDEADIVALVKTGRVDLSGFPLAPEKMAAFQELAQVAGTDPHPP